MRYIIVFIFAVALFTVNVFATQLIGKVNVDFPGTLEGKISGLSISGDVNTGYGFGVEVLSEEQNQFVYGAGLEYQVMREIPKVLGMDTNGAKFNFIPLYATINFYFLPKEKSNSRAFVKINFGYDMVYDGNSSFKDKASLTGDLYYALGGGVELNNKLCIQGLYSIYTGHEKYLAYSTDDKYSKFSVSLGYKFN